MKKNKVYGGIDPGAKGFIVVAKGEKDIACWPIPRIGKEYNHQEISKLFKYFSEEHEDIHFVLEGVNCDPRWGAKVNWSLGGCKEMLKQVLTDFKIPYTLVNPKAWQKEMWQGVTVQKKPSSTGKTMVTDTKKTSEIAAMRLFPFVDFNVTDKLNKSKNKNDNLIDAVLMAEYCKRNF